MTWNETENDRVRRNTAPAINAEIDSDLERQIRFYAVQSPTAISERIEELENEWSIERVLETQASTLALSGILLAATRSKKWLFLSGGVLGFFLWHGVKGWCPPLPVLRRLGVRTRCEIEREKYALKILRGDFEQVATVEEAKAAPDLVWEAVQL